MEKHAYTSVKTYIKDVLNKKNAINMQNSLTKHQKEDNVYI